MIPQRVMIYPRGVAWEKYFDVKVYIFAITVIKLDHLKTIWLMPFQRYCVKHDFMN